jgi:hypothetical protein
VFEHVVGDPLADLEVGEVELLVEGVALGLLHGDLQLRAPARGLLGEEFLDGDSEGGGQGGEEGELGLALAVLQQGELGGGPADAFSQVGEGHTSRAPQMTEPLTKGDEI